MNPEAFEKRQNDLAQRRREFAFKAGPFLIMIGCLLDIAGRVFLWKNDAGFDPGSGVSQSSPLTYVWVPIVTLVILCLVAPLIMIPYTLFVEVNERYINYPEYNPVVIPGFLWLHEAVLIFSAYLCPILMLAGAIIMGTALRRKKQVGLACLPGYPVPYSPNSFQPPGRDEV